MSSLIAYYPGKTFFHNLDPRAKIIFMVIVSTAIFTVQQIPVALVVLAVMICLWFSARLPFSVLLSFIKVLLPIIGFLFLVQAVFYPGTTPLIKPLIPIGKGIGQVRLARRTRQWMEVTFLQFADPAGISFQSLQTTTHVQQPIHLV